MPNTDYAFMSAYLKGEESKIVTSEHVDSMVKASNIQEVLRIIADTDIGSYLEEVPAKDFQDIDECLWVYFGQCLYRLQWLEFMPADMLKILSAYVAKYDAFNIKAALQSILTAKKAKMIPVGVIHDCGVLDELSRAEDLDSIVELLNECELGQYVPALEGHKGNGGVKSKLLAEAELDNEYYKNMLNAVTNIGDGAVLLRVFGFIIDLTNLQIILRAMLEGIESEAARYIISGGYMVSSEVAEALLSLKLTDVPSRLEHTQYRDAAQEILSSYERTRSITVVDEIIDKHKFRLAKELLSPRVLSPLVVAWYLILKEIEIRNMRLILKAIVDNISVQEVKKYLVL